jgi:hypothetical protein
MLWPWATPRQAQVLRDHRGVREEMTLTMFGITALTFMMVMYALERRSPVFVVGFALGCALSSAYGFLSGAWPFGIVEAIWTVIALFRLRVAPGAGVV